jgi:hypothetical protein
MLVYMEGCSEKIGGRNKTVEIDESKFGQGKSPRGHPVKGQWVFSVVERESGKMFLVPVLYSLFFHSVHLVINMTSDMSSSVYILYIT